MIFEAPIVTEMYTSLGADKLVYYLIKTFGGMSTKISLLIFSVILPIFCGTKYCVVTLATSVILMFQIFISKIVFHIFCGS